MAKQRYSLFEKVNGKWVRISQSSYYKQDAVRLYQNALLAYALGQVESERCLKIVKE